VGPTHPSDRPVPGRPAVAPVAALAAAVTVLGAAGAVPRWPGLLHLVALPPLDLVADLQWLVVRAPGVPDLAAGVIVSIAVRAALLAWLLGGLTWSRWWFAVRFYALVAPFAFVAATLRFASGAVLFYAFFWAGLVLTLVLLVVTGAAPWLGRDEQGRLRVRTGLVEAGRHGLRLGTLGAYLTGLLVLGVLADLGGPGWAVALVPASAALTWATAWVLLADPELRVVRRALAAVPAALAIVLVVVVVTGPAAPAEADRPVAGAEGSLLLLSGVDSSSGQGAILEIDPEAVLGWSCGDTFHFSYTGMGDGQPRGDAACPIDVGAPYEAEDTLRPRAEVLDALEAFAAVMPPPLVVVGHSQGAWLAWEAAAEGRLPGLEALILVAPFPENRVTFPDRGRRAPGAAGRHLLGLVEAVDMTVFEPDSPLGREWLGHPDAVEEVLARPLPDGVRALTVASSFDLPLLHGTHRVPGVDDACPVLVMHPNLPYAREAQEAIARFVEGRDQPSCSPLRYVPGPLLRHFNPPPSPGA
jgi:hypothetical protein